MKKILLFILLLATVLSAVSCGDGCYEPVESTAEEAQTVLTFTYKDKTYEVKYELYRALFLNIKSEIDGGEEEVWSGDDRDEYISKANSRIQNMLSYIYAAFAVCDDIGFDIYSSDVNNQISEYIKEAVNNEPYNGDYDKYLADLKAENLNYRSHELILRWGIATDAIDEYYIGTATADDISGQITIGNIIYSKDDVKTFYNSDECVRVIRACITNNGVRPTVDRAKDLRNAVLKVAHLGDEAVAAAMAGSGSITAQAELQNGYIIARHNLNRFYYGKMTDEAFKLSVGDVSDVITVVEDAGEMCYVIYRTDKSDEHFNSCYGDIASIFLSNQVGGILETAEQKLTESVKTSDFLNTLNYSEITMDVGGEQ